MSYGCYYSMFGRRWYYCAEAATLETAIALALSNAEARGALFARVTDRYDEPVWEGAL